MLTHSMTRDRQKNDEKKNTTTTNSNNNRNGIINDELEQSMIIISDRISFILFGLINFSVVLLVTIFAHYEAENWLIELAIQTTYKFLVSLTSFASQTGEGKLKNFHLLKR